MTPGLILPTQLPTAAGWALRDYAEVTGQSGPATAAGVATLELTQLDGDEMWLVDHAVASCTSAAATELRWYASTVADRALLDGTGRGNFDVADWPAGLRISPSQSLIARWTGATPGAVGTLTLQLRVLRRK